MFYSIQKWWANNGWYYMFFGSLIILALLWLFITKKDSGSSTTSWQQAVQTITRQEPSQFIHQNSFENLNLPTLDKTVDIEPKCSKGEKICKEVMKEITGKEFIKIRPDWLVNPITKTPLELDIFNEELQLAVEYNGEQHYKYNKFMHQNSKDKFYGQQYRDYIKKSLCEKKGIHLIEVPYTIAHKDIRRFLMKETQKYLNKYQS